MPRKALIFGTTNATIAGMLIYLFRTGELSGKTLPIVGVICFLAMNGLVFFMFRRRGV
jgi:LPXTG-motif cell wall-anchored protein